MPTLNAVGSRSTPLKASHPVNRSLGSLEWDSSLSQSRLGILVGIKLHSIHPVCWNTEHYGCFPSLC